MSAVPLAVVGQPTDLVQEARDRCLMHLGLVIVPFLVPISIYSFWRERYLLGLLAAAVVTIGVINSVALQTGRRRPIPLSLGMGVMLCGLLHSVCSLGITGGLWCYPVPLMYHFVATRAEARRCDFAFYGCLIPAAVCSMPAEIAFRFVLTLGMVRYFATILVRVIVDLQSQLTALTITDPLTGAFNRRHMNSCLSAAVDGAERGTGPLCVVMFDLDHFKQINDTLGHNVGDRVLRAVADLVRSRLRTVDQLFRTGGEEFLILLPETALSGAITLAEELRRRIEAEPIIDGRPVTASFGVAEYNGDEGLGSWCKRVDELLYRAKRTGRNRVVPAGPRDTQRVLPAACGAAEGTLIGTGA